MGLALRKERFYSPEEYLELERAAVVRHEYVDGEIYEMAGESLAHSRICVNISREISLRLKGTRCEALSPNMKVRAETKGMFAYPDLSIVCGDPVFHDLQKDVLLNPKVIIEVLSPSTQRYDQKKKFFRLYLTDLHNLSPLIRTSPLKAARPMPSTIRAFLTSMSWLLTGLPKAVRNISVNMICKEIKRRNIIFNSSH